MPNHKPPQPIDVAEIFQKIDNIPAYSGDSEKLKAEIKLDITQHTAQAVTTALQQVADGLPERRTQLAFQRTFDMGSPFVAGFNDALDQAHQAIATVKRQWEKTND